MSKTSLLTVGLMSLVSLASCVSLSPREYERLPENIQTSPLVEEGSFVYSEREFNNADAENTVLITGKSGRQKFSLKDEIFSSGLEKRAWNFSVKSAKSGNSGDSEENGFDVEVKFDVDSDDEEDKKYRISPVLFEENHIEIPDRIDTGSVQIPYMVAKIHDKDGICYKVFVTERSRFSPDNPKHIVLDTKQEFSVFLENSLVATFSGGGYKIYSEEKRGLLKKYAAVLNGIFRGVQRYEKGLYLF